MFPCILPFILRGAVLTKSFALHTIQFEGLILYQDGVSLPIYLKKEAALDSWDKCFQMKI